MCLLYSPSRYEKHEKNMKKCSDVTLFHAQTSGLFVRKRQKHSKFDQF